MSTSTSEPAGTEASATRDAEPAQTQRSLVRRGLQFVGTLGPMVPFLALFVVLALASSHFLSKTNLLNILQANAEIGIGACAGTLVIVAGGVDLSVGAVYAVAGVLSAKVAISTGVGVGMAAGIGAGVGLGLLNGLVVSVGGVNGLIATIAGGIVFAGAAQVLAGQSLLTPTSQHFGTLGTGRFLGVYYSSWIFIAAAVACGLISAASRFGRDVRVTGANPEAARLSGVPVNRVRCLTYVLSGAAAAIAGVVAVSQSGQAQATIGGTPFVLSVIAAIAVGGTSLRGGQGSIWKTVVGVLFLGLVTNGLALLNVNPLYYQFFTGLIILAAMAREPRAWRGSGTIE